jgi:hypothetical protein
MTNYATRLERLEQLAPKPSTVWVRAIIDCDEAGSFTNAEISGGDGVATISRRAGESVESFKGRIRASRPRDVNWIDRVLVRAPNGLPLSDAERRS